MRIERHPILDIPENREKVTIYVNGEPIEAVKGDVVVAALLAAGYKTFRKTPKYHRPRGIFCAIGRCTDCALTINGVPNVRSCVTPVEDGMQIMIRDGLGTWE